MESREDSGAKPQRNAEAPLGATRVRALLRKLRDLDLHTGSIATARQGHARVAGCLSLDAPVEGSVRYLLELQDGAQRVLEIRGCESALDLSLWAGQSGARIEGRRVGLKCDVSGRVLAPEIQARLHPDSTDPRDFEHFLRRCVRAFGSRFERRAS